MAGYDAVVVDLKINGLLSHLSIVQFSALFLQAGKIRKVVNRYYFPKEKVNPNAVEVHGLTLKRIAFLRERQEKSYAEHFEDDEELLSLLKKVFPQAYLIAYNSNFERKFWRCGEFKSKRI